MLFVRTLIHHRLRHPRPPTLLPKTASVLLIPQIEPQPVATILIRAMSAAAPQPQEPKKPSARRDALRAIEKRVQSRWEEDKVFEKDAPLPGEPSPPKFLVTFPYPYMNGKLHLGHSFSVSKCEFNIGYQQLKGKRALFPFGFHCTGMPIKACADKLLREIDLFGQNFEKFKEEVAAEPEPEPQVEATGPVDPTKIVKKHGKVNSKSTGLKYQFQIMRSMGVPNEEIHKFADPKHWLYYFPPHAISDLKDFGAHIDWRRSFITTDVNPYYDSFIRWQFNKLKSLQPVKIDFGERLTIYSPLDGQACMDHDRATGEGVGVQEYTAIKLQVQLAEMLAEGELRRDIVQGKPVGQKITQPEFLERLGDRKLYYVAATLRPETMYGQTNCYVGVDLDYGVFIVNKHEAYICTERAARNMAFQGIFEERGKVNKITDLKGWDLVGVPLSAPLAQFPTVYTLPMEGVLAAKGTGVVTSVPSDSPDDYITLQDLSKKPVYYGIQPKWVEPFFSTLKPIIQTPNYGDLAAKTAVEKLKIKSQKDKKELAEAKELVYKEGFYSGTMVVGSQAGKPVQEAKPIIRAELIEQGLAFAYAEPDGLVVSRSGDECVVTPADQWFMNYGEQSWRQTAESCLAKMETFGPETRNAFEKTLAWLNQWACSRSYGLGTRLPWDPQYLIESLSDSTIYMAYYTVAHLLHGGNLDGSKPGPLGIKAEQMSHEVWEFILNKSAPFPQTDIQKESLELMRREFQYFYPVDLRSSGKDLIGNHLTFFIYNHVALFDEEFWPKAVRTNGHLLLNGEKMSKSTGNFMTLNDAVSTYGADATRFALADAGDALDDANFLDKTADDAILKLFIEKEWIEESLRNGGQDLRSGELNWIDRVFASELQKIASEADKAYQSMLYREALKFSFYEIQNARNEYRKATVTATNMHVDLVKQFVEIEALLMSPITPHWSEYIWSEVLAKPTSIQKAHWPTFTVPVDESLLAAADYIRDLVSKIRSAEDAAAKKKAKKGGKTEEKDDGPKSIRIYVAETFPQWQDEALSALKECWDSTEKKFIPGKDKEILTQRGLIKDKRVMPFVAAMKKTVEVGGAIAFDRALPFHEYETLSSNVDFIARELAVLKIAVVDIVKKETVTLGPFTEEDVKKADGAAPAVPGQPTYRIW
ncbi:uncharacterized protein BJ171DRAFT_539063 [Polychytrium aggregatum]|uniref:uncharacterized protein n=1 Tax=Polychytrium aggregatum TaxID=110093 RepID=UPI0022FED591|nr:uncharacterized protein BJ171DRAFT_539063 [Polychytrium aggregatum]KAI9190829.1 hypothetical protein BJ171DRAFT_539063 [Polychytrium aggregatum]